MTGTGWGEEGQEVVVADVMCSFRTSEGAPTILTSDADAFSAPSISINTETNCVGFTVINVFSLFCLCITRDTFEPTKCFA